MGERTRTRLEKSDVLQMFPWLENAGNLDAITVEIASFALTVGIYDPAALKTLYYGLSDASGVHESVGGIYDAGTTVREMRDALTSLVKALFKIEQGKGSLDVAQASIAKAVALIPPEYLHALDTVTPALFDLPPLDEEKSNFEVIALSLSDISEPERKLRAQDLQGAVSVFLQDIKTPGKGGARRDARHYVAGIMKLADWFSEALPDHAISANENSVFYRYAAWWLENREGMKTDPKRHIKGAVLELKKG